MFAELLTFPSLSHPTVQFTPNRSFFSRLKATIENLGRSQKRALLDGASADDTDEEEARRPKRLKLTKEAADEAGSEEAADETGSKEAADETGSNEKAVDETGSKEAADEIRAKKTAEAALRQQIIKDCFSDTSSDENE